MIDLDDDTSKNKKDKFAYLDNLKFLSKMKLDKEEKYEPKILYYEGEKVKIVVI